MSDPADRPVAGDIWNYPFLWARQAARGETAGRKERPCALALVQRKHNGETQIVLLAITGQQPMIGQLGLEVPETERFRAGLSRAKRLWVMLDEYNTDVIERSYSFEPGGKIGSFTPGFVRKVQAAFADALRNRTTKAVRRED